MISNASWYKKKLKVCSTTATLLIHQLTAILFLWPLVLFWRRWRFIGVVSQSYTSSPVTAAAAVCTTLACHRDPGRTNIGLNGMWPGITQDLLSVQSLNYFQTQLWLNKAQGLAQFPTVSHCDTHTHRHKHTHTHKAHAQYYHSPHPVSVFFCASSSWQT